ncbi:MAG: glycosyltransferase [Thermoleophilaceae bacterium]|nr:glycosyltransferase [Thermoleophilaceae bacterium]
MSAPDVSVVVPSWGVAPTLPDLFSALRGQTLDPSRFEVLVVDAGVGGGMERLQELAQGWDGPTLRLVRGPLPGGPAARRNHGAAEATGALLAFTDADCAPDPGWLEAGLEAARAGAEIVQGVTLPPEGASVSPFDHHHHLVGETGLYETCNVFYDRGLFARLGGFTSRYFDRYLVPFGEDVELGWRARRSGARYSFESRAIVRHAVTRRSAQAQLRYMWQGRGFPLLARDVPELREAFFYRRFFLSRRTASVAAAAAGLLLARRVPPAAALAIPYVRRMAVDRSVPAESPSERVRQTALRVASDFTLLAGLLWGSARWRRLVL